MIQPKRGKPRRSAQSARQSPENPASLTKRGSHESKDASRKLDLFFIRHGEAGTRLTDRGEDSERRLTLRGRNEIQRISRSLRNLGLKTERIYTSPLPRARETAQIAARILKVAHVEEWDELKPEGDRESLYIKLVKGRDSHAVLVGHEPNLTSMIGDIIGTPGARLILKKGGLAKVRVTSFTPQLHGELRWLLTPKLITRMS